MRRLINNAFAMRLKRMREQRDEVIHSKERFDALDSAIENTFPRNEVSAVNEQLSTITENFVYDGGKFYWKLLRGRCLFATNVSVMIVIIFLLWKNS